MTFVTLSSSFTYGIVPYFLGMIQTNELFDAYLFLH